MYVFDMETLDWERIPNHPDDQPPRSRYFHSADACMSIWLTIPLVLLTNRAQGIITSSCLVG